MKATIIAVVIVVMMSVALAYRDSAPISYVKEQVEVVKEVRPDWATDEDAVKAAQAVIRKKELESERGELQSQIDEMKKRVTEIDKELGTY